MSSLYQMLSELVQITHSAGKPIVSMGANLKIYRTEKFNIIIALFKDWIITESRLEKGISATEL